MILYLTPIATEHRHTEGEGKSVWDAGFVCIVEYWSHSQTLYTFSCTVHHLFITNFGDN